jgi:fatty acid desaturase
MVTSTSTKEINVSYYLHHKKPLWNAIAFLYILTSYVGGIAFLLLPNGFLNALGVVLLTHSMVLSAYLTHEFMHGTIFTDMKWNTVGGSIMLWLNGGCYGRFRDLVG